MALALCAAMMMGTFGGFEVKAADDSSATEMEFWTFVELHGQFYENMAEKWNEAMNILKDLYDAKAIGTVPGGNPDKEEAYGAFNSGDYACAIMPMWQMSRYTSYMPELSGKIAIAPAPVVEDTKEKSVGGGGTGTVRSPERTWTVNNRIEKYKTEGTCHMSLLFYMK